MTTKVEKSVTVDVPVTTAYNQWTQFEQFPQFMGGVEEVRQLDDVRTHWVAEIAGVRREWDATILEQVPDRKIAWAATEGATNAGAVYFEPVGASSTRVTLSLEFEPEGVVEKAGDALNIVEKRTEADLQKFKSLIESQGFATGAWRGQVPGAAGTPTTEDAAETRGDSGKAGISGKAVAGAAAATAVAGAVAAAAAKKASSSESTPVETEVRTTEERPATTTAAPTTTAPTTETAPSSSTPTTGSSGATGTTPTVSTLGDTEGTGTAGTREGDDTRRI